MSNFKDKNVVISGGSRGIGLSIGKKLANEGANIAILAKTDVPHPKLPGTIFTAAKEIEKNRIGTIRTKHDGLVQQGDVFTTSLGRTPGGRGRDRGISRDTF